ncbi:1-aminocyclopropane-1-carboxylate deaminase [Flavobacterium branchiophilum NBRC 15030 = ATCC 35035]|uniref:1-aminocyclopropane-1-carboxylate deaminase n=1 Tax=Flavobacterium branchiophilum TaxID=55197 RepID=A0A543G646_9FLAO|nr:pyridoxal-phosphate dependent enzyme [Flavobacterium branchiophilum]OXA73565.1 1-aminocyclopropane-1-carboxylate deaminase [Flavobacterium branchiophilum NBRC 15030 = ATCC 35035]TQM41454.1 1-aminocyclopropane-1-carboxylate deaminase [Flavobacterium branchiophilum]GEM55342.1 1-aminocyclopropane-1-carboxylate deaminase [Flavobacterium branchiophilum NBRC 15030 = ATCC 35035]
MTPINQLIYKDEAKNIAVYMKRIDRIHPQISGNKFYKLQYNLKQALAENYKKVLTFGGAFSNHIAATAFAGQSLGLQTIGVIRGEELVHKIDDNLTLKQAQEYGMTFEFVSRETYRNKNTSEFLATLNEKLGSFYTIPEGGTNALAIKGCEEILDFNDKNFNYICTAVGTGGTISGLINSAEAHQKVLGFPALKGSFLNDDIQQWTTKNNWELIQDYHFGGYGKMTVALIAFMNQFLEAYQILLDPVYTAKMVFGVFDLIEKQYFENNATILMIHTGGLQGIEGMNRVLEKKKINKINIK